MRVCIIGGGIIGLSIAFELALQKTNVILVDSYANPGMATKAAAGMLEPLALDKPLLETGLQSLALYPEFLARLGRISSLETGYHQTGIIYLEKGLSDCKDRIALLAEYDFNIEQLNGDNISRKEPLVQTGGGAVFSPQSAQIEPRKLYYALYDACAKLNVDFISADIRGIKNNNGMITAVETKSKKITADTFIISAGAWSASLLRQLGIEKPIITPVKGQILTLRTTAEIKHIIRDTNSFYIVPRLDGRVVVGATSEHGAGFDTAINDETITALHDRAARFFPVLKDAAIINRASGLRPYPKNDAPFAGAVENYDNLYLASGHYRNGILLAPHTAQTIAKQLLR